MILFPKPSIRIEQFGAWVEVSTQLRRPNGSWHGTDLHRSWYGYLIGFTEPADDEEAANYAAVEADRLIRSMTTQPAQE